MPSTSTVKELALKIDKNVAEANRGIQPSAPWESETATFNDVNGVSLVRQLTQAIDEKVHAELHPQQEVDDAVQTAVSEVRAAGHVVTSNMISYAKHEALLGKDATMKDQVRRVLLREAAVRSALREAEESGVVDPRRWINEAEARLAASSGGTTEYETMLSNAIRALTSDRMVYVVCLNSYKRAGVSVVLSLSSLAEQFEMTVSRELRVDELLDLIEQERLQRRPAGPGKTIEVKLMGPAGTLLPREQVVTCALDCETAELESDVEHGVFYPLSVLTSSEWRDLGLVGVTRWKHLREDLFMGLFGMTKATFEKLPEWKQTPLKKKHGLF